MNKKLEFCLKTVVFISLGLMFCLKFTEIVWYFDTSIGVKLMLANFIFMSLFAIHFFLIYILNFKYISVWFILTTLSIILI